MRQKVLSALRRRVKPRRVTHKGKDYVVQSITFRDKVVAESLADRIEAHGKTAKVVKVKQGYIVIWNPKRLHVQGGSPGDLAS